MNCNGTYNNGRTTYEISAEQAETLNYSNADMLARCALGCGYGLDRGACINYISHHSICRKNKLEPVTQSIMDTCAEQQKAGADPIVVELSRCEDFQARRICAE